jgi:2-oxoisovalerate dehydrogenase E2 component (dihydrolipoyl transacylase)
MSRVKEFKLPDLGEGLTEGEILKWLVSVGDTVTLNQPIVEVETAKAAVEIPAKWAGQITAIFHAEGQTVEVGTPIIAIDTDPGAGEPPAPGGSAGSPTATPSADSLAAVEVAGDDAPVEPGLIGGPAPGGRTAVLVGYGPRTAVAKRRPRKGAAEASPPGAEAPATSPAPQRATPMTMDIEGGLSAAEAAADALAHRATWTSNEPGTLSPHRPAVADTPDDGRTLAKPPVRKLARDLGVSLLDISGTGPKGSVTRNDVLAAYSSPAAPAEPSTRGVDAHRERRIPVKGVRKLTAENMVASAFSAPHVTEFLTLDMTRSMRVLDRLRKQAEWRAVRLSPLLLVAKAVLLGIGRQPMINSTWSGETGEIVVKDYVNLGVAAATPRGLLVPNIKDADRLSLRELADAMNVLVATAREGRTQPADMAGGTFTITNVGVFGVDTGTPILPPGEAAILAFGAVREAPWVHKRKIRIRQVTTLGLSFDHRIVDGELGSMFLRDVGAFLSDPEAALLGWG